MRLKKIVLALCMALALISLTGVFKPVSAQAATTLTKTKVKNEFFTFTEGDGKVKIEFSGMPSGATVKYKSDNKKVAKVTKYGYIYPKGAGSCTITCTLKHNGKTKKLKVYVTVKEAYNLGKLWKQAKKDGKVDIQEINANIGDIIYVEKIGSIFGFKGDADKVRVGYTLEELDYYWDAEKVLAYITGINNAGYESISFSGYGTRELYKSFRSLVYEGMQNGMPCTRETNYYECLEAGTFYLFYPAGTDGGHYQKITVSDKTSEGIRGSSFEIDSAGDFSASWNIDEKYISAKTYVYEYKNGSFVKTKKTIAKDTVIFIQGTYNGYLKVYWGADMACECKNTGWIPAGSYDGVKVNRDSNLTAGMVQKWTDNWGYFSASDAKKLGWGDANGFYESDKLTHNREFVYMYISIPSGFLYNFVIGRLFHKDSTVMKLYNVKSECVEAHYACIYYQSSGFDKCGNQYHIYYISDKEIAGISLVVD